MAELKVETDTLKPPSGIIVGATVWKTTGLLYVLFGVATTNNYKQKENMSLWI